jgi:ComF family protein
VSVAAYYEGPVKELILALKFRRQRAAAEAAGALVLRRAEDWPALDMVTSVPVSPARHRERGYNQSELVAQVVACRLGLPYSALLGRLGSDHQLGAGRQERLRQVTGAFFAKRRLAGSRVLLIDDVVTTGATLAECARALEVAGAGALWGAVVARH